MDPFADDVKKRWICCQIGAREHYSIPAGLLASEQLELLITDYWNDGKQRAITAVTRNLQGRRHIAIPDDKVVSFNLKSLFFEGWQKLRSGGGWQLVIHRNEWFQKQAVKVIQNQKLSAHTIFSYSYSARQILRAGKQKGWRTVLGQIDPGPEEEKIVTEEVKRYPQYQSEWQPAPLKYWGDWREECELADEIIVNSEWSLKALLKQEINQHKIHIKPLTYSIPPPAVLFQRHYPNVFSRQRPLRVLFLGQVILRKGIARLIDAAKLLLNKPVEFVVVGPIGIHPLPTFSNIKWMGRAARLDTEKYFRDCDVFLFPTLSDGFGLTQLEARAWLLPMIVSPFCGTVVRNQHDGWLMEDISGSEIASILNQILDCPSLLPQFSNAIIRK